MTLSEALEEQKDGNKLDIGTVVRTYLQICLRKTFAIQFAVTCSLKEGHRGALHFFFLLEFITNMSR